MKRTVATLLATAVANAEKEDREEPVTPLNLNRVFLGNPGTGKTTVAKIYARILHDFGLVSQGGFISKLPSDFKGRYVGQSEANTSGILAEAVGNVLLIDEAYGLNPVDAEGKGGDVFSTVRSSSCFLLDSLSYRGISPPCMIAHRLHARPGHSRATTALLCLQAVVNTICGYIPGDGAYDGAVVLCGYREQMDLMLGSNVGLARRFNLSSAFDFENFTEAELVQIVKFQAGQRKLVLGPGAEEAFMKILRARMPSKDFGNGGEARASARTQAAAFFQHASRCQKASFSVALLALSF